MIDVRDQGDAKAVRICYYERSEILVNIFDLQFITKCYAEHLLLKASWVRTAVFLPPDSRRGTKWRKL